MGVLREIAFSSLMLLALASCGGQGSKGEADSTPQNSSNINPTGANSNTPPKAPVDTIPSSPSPTTPSGPVSPRGKIYLASAATQTISAYTSDGTFINFIDLTRFGPGFVTAMTWLDSSTLLAFFDPGSQGEKIMKVSFTADSVSSIDADWYKDINLSLVSVPKLFSQGFASSPLVLIAKMSASLEAISTDASFSRAVRSGSPHLMSSSNCPLAGNSYVTRNSTGDRMILGNSSSTTPRLNVYDHKNVCLSSYNFGSSFPALSSASVAGIVASNESVFVRYSHSTNPVLVKCAFDGTTISSCFDLIGETSVLGLNRSSKELIAGTEPDSLLAPNWDTGTIMQINGITGQSTALIRDIFSSKVNSISIRP